MCTIKLVKTELGGFDHILYCRSHLISRVDSIPSTQDILHMESIGVARDWKNRLD